MVVVAGAAAVRGVAEEEAMLAIRPMVRCKVCRVGSRQASLYVHKGEGVHFLKNPPEDLT